MHRNEILDSVIINLQFLVASSHELTHLNGSGKLPTMQLEVPYPTHSHSDFEADIVV